MLINRICFAMCIVCIVTGTTLSILGVWKLVDTEQLFWKALSTLGIVFLGAFLTAAVNKLIIVNTK